MRRSYICNHCHNIWKPLKKIEPNSICGICGKGTVTLIKRNREIFIHQTDNNKIYSVTKETPMLEHSHELSKRTLDLLSEYSLTETLRRMKSVVDKECLLECLRRIKEQSECKACKENLAKGGTVCPSHWHDYANCGRSDCLMCTIARSIGFETNGTSIHIGDKYKPLTENEKEWARRIYNNTLTSHKEH